MSAMNTGCFGVPGWRLAACLLAAVSALATAAVAEPRLQAAASPPDRGFNDYFAGASLLDQEGRRFSVSAGSGRVQLINFVFTGCSMVCPIQTRALAELQAALPRATRQRVRFVSISLDPMADTPAVLKAYASRMGADLSNWSFVTGRTEDIEHISRRLQLYPQSADAKQPQDHATALWLLNQKGQIVQRYTGNPVDLKRLTRELESIAMP